MNTQKMNWVVNRAVFGAAYWAVYRAVAVNWAVREAVRDAILWPVNRAAHWADAVADAVYLTVNEDPPHPGLQDFLRFADVRES